MRLFVALDIPAQAAAYLTDVQQKLRQELQADRWQSLDNLHLTLHFLGDVEEQLVPAVCEDLNIVSAITKPFRLRLGELGAFPNPSRPRVLWLGLRGNTQALRQHHLLLGKRFELHDGLDYDRRAYKPHITLARGPKASAEGLPLEHWNTHVLAEDSPHWQVNQVHLYRSELRPEGAVHTIVHTSTFDEDYCLDQT